jgi:hypothetical protein
VILQVGCYAGSDVRACAQANPDDVDTNVLTAANAMSLNENVTEGSELGSWSSDGEEFGSPFLWVEESCKEDLDYFAALDLAASESPP